MDFGVEILIRRFAMVTKETDWSHRGSQHIYFSTSQTLLYLRHQARAPRQVPTISGTNLAASVYTWGLAEYLGGTMGRSHPKNFLVLRLARPVCLPAYLA